jgi:Pentapeptide repeats (8 copies)
MSPEHTILVRTDFSKSGLTETRFAEVALMDVKLRMTDLRRTVFEN